MLQVQTDSFRFVCVHGRRALKADRTLRCIAVLACVLGAAWGQGSVGTGSAASVEGASPQVTHEQPLGGSFTTGEAASHVIFEALLSTSDADWARQEHPSVVLTLEVDGLENGDLVVTGPERPYRELVGPLAPGRHQWWLRWHKCASPQARGAVTARTVRITPERSALAVHAPRIFGRLASDKQRAVMATSDVPLLLLGRANGEELEYTLVFSNEDGGTGLLPALLMRQYGRTSDIERVCSVKGSRRSFQGANHVTREFRGTLEGAHPLLRVATDNNNFSDDLGDRSLGLRFALAPQPFPERGPRDRVLEREGWIAAIANAEMGREVTELIGLIGKRKMESPGDAATVTLSDLRNYIAFEVHVEAAKDVVWRVGARAAGQWYWSDHGIAREREHGSGWPRTAVELPPRSVADAVCVECCLEGGTLNVLEFRAWAFDAAVLPRPDGAAVREPVPVRSGAPLIRTFKP